MAKHTSVEARFWVKVEKTETCWLWMACTYSGYGVFWLNGHNVMANRWAFEQAGGVIGSGMHLDHLCRTRNCVNPKHLEPVTPGENVLRSPITITSQNLQKTHCVNGHEFTSENTYIRRSGGRECRACRPAAKARYRRALTERQARESFS